MSLLDPSLLKPTAAGQNVADQKGSSPQTSVVVIAKNEEGTIAKCLSSVLKQDHPNFEIIFVDSGSVDHTSDIVKSLAPSDRRVIFADSKGNAAAARNQGIRLARGDVIAFVDGDCYLDEHWLRRATNYLQATKNSHVAAVGGPFVQVPQVETMTTRTISDIESTKLGRGGSTLSPKQGSGKYARSLSLSGAVFTASAIKQVGFFDERLGYCEDSDFCQRTRSAGYKLLSFGDMGSFHTPKYRSLREFAAKMWKYGAGRGRAIRHDRNLIAASGLAALTYLLIFTVALITGFGMGLPIARFAAVALASLYLALIFGFSAAISFRRKSISSLFVALAAFMSLHIPYTVGMIAGIIVPSRSGNPKQTRATR